MTRPGSRGVAGRPATPGQHLDEVPGMPVLGLELLVQDLHLPDRAARPTLVW